MMRTKYINNQTVKFILPLITNLSAATLLNDNFIGAYVGDIEKPQWDGNILLAYKFTGDIDSVRFDKKIYNLDNYVSSYDYDDNQIVVYVLKVPEEVEESVEYIIDGYYSKINTMDKLQICKFWSAITTTSIVTALFASDSSAIQQYWKDINMLEKRSLCRDGEYWFKPDFDEELLNISDM